jgi:DNA-binding NarL/FixJ family response regulator
MCQKLTDRECQVLKLIADGLTNKEISHSLSVSEATVENHAHHIYVKLGVSSRTEAMVYTFRLVMALQYDSRKMEEILHDTITNIY